MKQKQLSLVWYIKKKKYLYVMNKINIRKDFGFISKISSERII